MHYTTTERCNTLQWGDYKGHKARGEDACPRCASLAAARKRVSTLRCGHCINLDGPDLLAITAEFNRLLTQPHDGVPRGKLLIQAVENVFISRVPLAEVKAAA